MVYVEGQYGCSPGAPSQARLSRLSGEQSGLRLWSDRAGAGGNGAMHRWPGLIAVVRGIVGHRVGKGILKALEEKGRVEAAVRTALASLFGRGKGRVSHDEGQVLWVRKVSPGTSGSPPNRRVKRVATNHMPGSNVGREFPVVEGTKCLARTVVSRRVRSSVASLRSSRVPL